MSEPETQIDWTEQIAILCRRFEHALRAGDTCEGLEAWLLQVPEEVRPALAAQLQRCRDEIGSESIETRVVSSDAIVANGHLAIRAAIDSGSESGSAVAGCETFQGLSLAAREALQQNFSPSSFPAGSPILLQGQPAPGLHLILSGFVDIIDSEAGERIDCDGAGSVLGEMSLLMDQPCSATVVATSHVEALVLSTAAYHSLKAQHPEIEIALSQLVSDRLGGRRHDALCGKTIGSYQLKRCINRGGMGVVYEARQIDTSEVVALKMLRHRFIYDDQMQQRFEQEAKLLSDLRHPNIVSLRGNFLAYRTRFLVLDLCDGSDLYQVLRSRGALDEATVRAIVGQIAKGLLYAHSCGVVHRDLKPGNVLVDRSGQVQLTDFGLSRLLESEVLGGKAVGTPSYMPPEQFRTDRVGPECDWYALGCLICEMLTSRILFTPRKWLEMFELKRVMKPNDHWPEVPASDELRGIIQGCLEPEAGLRHVDLERLSSWADSVEWLFQSLAQRPKSHPSDSTA